MTQEELHRYLSPESQKLFESLFLLKKDLSKVFDEKFNRSIPFSEMLFNRWDRAKDLSFGEGTSVYDSALVFGKVLIGKNTWVGPFVVLDGSGELQIGDTCSISAGVQIYSHNTVNWALSGGKEKYQYKPTKIGNCCFIGPMAIIQNGVTMGDHCLIGANSFVNKDIPPFSIVAGTPAKLIGKVKLYDNGKIELNYFKK